MLRCTALRVSRSAHGCLRNSVTRAAAGVPAAGRAVLEDVERLTRGEAAKRRGTGSRAVPHRLNADERALWDLAKVCAPSRAGVAATRTDADIAPHGCAPLCFAQKRRFMVLSGTGHRRERKGSPLANSWRQFADALLMPALMVQTGTAERPDLVVVDLSPLREGRARCLLARDQCLALSARFAATLGRDDAESASETTDELLDQAIWQLPPVLLEFVCADRPSAKAFAEALCLELCGGPQAEATSSKRRARAPDDEDV